jgi:hypothetical protein
MVGITLSINNAILRDEEKKMSYREARPDISYGSATDTELRGPWPTLLILRTFELSSLHLTSRSFSTM